jgi:hypothetical protein
MYPQIKTKYRTEVGWRWALQMNLHTYPLVMIRVFVNSWHRSGKMCWNPILHIVYHALTTKDTLSSSHCRPCKKKFLYTLPVWRCDKNVWTYHSNTHSTSPHINTEMMCVSSMDFTTWILLCPLMLIVDICNAISTKRCLICEEHWWDKNYQFA